MKKSINSFRKQKERKEPITWVTAYSYPMAYCAEQAGIDMILVGDSGGMTELGYKTTNPVTMDEMISMASAARRGAPDTFLVGDMPQGSYEASNEEAVRNAIRFVKESGCDAVKLEGGERVCKRVRAIKNAGIVVIGHLGLTPQSVPSFGGYRVQGRTLNSFEDIFDDVSILNIYGIDMLLLEAMPSEPAGVIAKTFEFPVLGIGAGNQVDGQLLIMHDLLGFYHDFRPKFAKCYIPQVVKSFGEWISIYGSNKNNDGLTHLITLAIKEYVKEVKDKTFPSEEYIYSLKEEELEILKTSTRWLK